MRFSSPITTSRLRRPMSPSIQTTLAPPASSATPMLAVAVVLPTPPLPEVTVTTFPGIARLLLVHRLASDVPTLSDNVPVLQPRHLGARLTLAAGRGGDMPGNAQLCRR